MVAVLVVRGEGEGGRVRVIFFFLKVERLVALVCGDGGRR